MKSVMKHGSSDAVAQARVEREILQRVAHPFIIQLHCAFQTRERLLLVLEICPGGDLKAQLSRCGRFSSEVAAFISGQVRILRAGQGGCEGEVCVGEGYGLSRHGRRTEKKWEGGCGGGYPEKRTLGKW